MRSSAGRGLSCSCLKIRFCIVIYIFYAIFDVIGGDVMRTTISIDDALLADAREMSGVKDTGPLIRAALEALIQREAALRLARLGGSEPQLKDIPRRRV